MSDQSENRFWWCVFALLLAMCGLLGFVLLRGEDGSHHGIPHPVKADMMIGGPAEQRTGDLIWIGTIFGSLQLVFFVALLAPGFRRRIRATGTVQAILWGGGLIYIALFVLVMYQYNAELRASEPSSSGWPRSTWLAIFALWPCPYLFVATYAFGFRNLIHSTDHNASR